MPLTVRRATPADAPTIVEFNRLLAEESESKTLDLDVLSAGVAAALADPAKGPYFLAEHDGELVGQMQVTYEFSDWRNGWFWWIQSVYVRPDARRRGVFRALYQYVEEAAKNDPEVIGLRLYVERENERAHKTYLGLGMEWTSYLLMERYPL
jgi:GNAT superfamily N-acetyltransferase